MYYDFYKNIKQHNFLNDNNKNIYLLANQHIRMISEGSCDAENWSNDAEKPALHCRN